MELLVFVSSTCAHCPKAEQVVRIVCPEYSEYGLTYEKVRTRSQRGSELSEKYMVMSVPTLIFLNDKGIEINRIIGVPSEIWLRNKIEILLGIKETFLKKIFGNKKKWTKLIY